MQAQEKLLSKYGTTVSEANKRTVAVQVVFDAALPQTMAQTMVYVCVVG